MSLNDIRVEALTTDDVARLEELFDQYFSDAQTTANVIKNRRCPLALKQKLIDKYLDEEQGLVDYAEDKPNFKLKIQALKLALKDFRPAEPEEAASSPLPVIEQPEAKKARRSLEAGRPVLLKGPPGTSKTYLARGLAGYFAGQDSRRVRSVQFHPSWSYEDFVEAQQVTMERGEMRISVVPRVFRKLCEAAKASFDASQRKQTEPEKWVLIIDEINRADVSRVFGELLSSLEYRDAPAQLLYSSKPLPIPPNLLIIATMNDWDRSTVDIDYALMRRFDEVRMEPSEDGLKQVLNAANEQIDPTLLGNILDLFQRIRKIYEPSGIGHAFFKSIRTPEDLERVWTTVIRPTLNRRDGIIPGMPGAKGFDRSSELDAFVKQICAKPQAETAS
jgi:MoxR-like ATPase